MAYLRDMIRFLIFGVALIKIEHSSFGQHCKCTCKKARGCYNKTEACFSAAGLLCQFLTIAYLHTCITLISLAKSLPSQDHTRPQQSFP